MKPFQIFFFLLIVVSIAFIFVNKDKFSSLDSDIAVVSNAIETTDSVTDNLKTDFVELDTTSTLSQGYLMFQGAGKCLESFFESLSFTKDSLIRIIYYGDSQIEGDHLTYTLRNKLQHKFGGNGIGFMPFELYYNTTEQLAIVTNDFEKNIVSYSTKSDNKFGIYGRYFKPTKKKNIVRIVNRNKNHLFKNVKLLYSGESDLIIEDEKEKTLLYSEEVGIDTIKFETTPYQLRLEFYPKDNFKTFGLLFDDENGVAVDNVSFRGNLNLMMNKFDTGTYKQMGSLLKPSLVIIHFGLNVVPDQKKDYDNYRLAIERDLKLIKQYLPDCSIMLVGVSDMAHKVDGKLVSYSNIKLIVEAQKMAAKNEQVAFWDIRAAMGGDGSSIEWVNKNWARTDYAHMNLKGTNKIGELLSRDLLDAYNQYLLSND